MSDSAAFTKTHEALSVNGVELRSILALNFINLQTCFCTDFLDLYLEFDLHSHLSTRIYDKWDDFNFEILNFPHLSSNIPTSPAYGLYISQLIRYSRACSSYSDFVKCHQCLSRKLMNQGYAKERLVLFLKKVHRKVPRPCW